MKILLTGAAGFIGSHLAKSLLKQGHSLYAIDNFDPFYSRSIKEKNIKDFLGQPGFNFIENDILNIESISELKLSCDLVIHLAAKAGIRPSIEKPGDYIQANVIGTHRILEWMKKNNCKKMIFASSSSVYGNNKKTPFSESDQVNEPISPYALTKRACELLNYNYHHLYDFSIINLRFFTVYGPRQRPDLAIHKFFNLIYDNQPVQIFGDGTTGRDYTYIDDTIAGILSSVNRIMKNEKVFEIINLGNNKPVLLKDLVDLIEKISGKKVKRNFLPMQDGDVDLTFADISLAKERLGYSPSTSIEEGLKKFKSWYETK